MCLNTPILQECRSINYDMFTHEVQSEHACNFSCLIENEGLLKVTGSHVEPTL